MPGEEVGSAYATIGIKIDEAGLSAAQSKITSSVRGIESGMGGLKSSLGSELSASFSGIASSMGPVGSALTALGPAGIAAGAGIAVVGTAISSSVSTAASFQSAMSSVNSVLGGSAESYNQLSAAAREAGASTQFSATEAANGLYFLASAGYSTEDTITALDATLNMAGASGESLARSAELLTTDLAVFQLGAEEAANTTDILATAAAKSNTNVIQMAEALARVGGTANGLGIGLKETTSVLEVLANNGIKGSEAGTKLNAIFGQLTKASSAEATKAQAAAMAEMGITAEQLNPELNSQAQIWELLNEKQMTSAQSLALFGLENTSAAQGLAASAGKITEFGNQLDNASGAAKKMNEEVNNNLNGAMKEFSSAVEEGQIILGNLFIPGLTSGVKFLTSMTTAATDTAKAIGNLAGSWNDWISSSVADSAALEKEYETTNKGHWEMIAGDAVWIGDEFGQAIAQGVAESDDLKDAPGEALGSPEALAGAGEAGKDLAKSVSEEFIPGLEAGMKDLDILAMINSQETAYNATFDRIFDYAGKSLRMHLSEGASGNFWSLYSGDTLLGKSFGGDAAAAFQAITGMPAPAEGAAAYYRLMGDAAEAEKVELQQRLQATPLDIYTGEEQAAFQSQNEEIWANFGESTAQIISDNFDYIGKSGSEDAKAAMDIILDAFAHPDASKVNAVSAALKGLTDSMLDPSQAARLAEDFKASILPHITDMKAFCTSQGEEMGKAITDAFSDSFFSVDDRALVVAMDPLLDALAAEAPEEFAKSGLAAIEAFVEAAKSGASDAELASMWATISGQAKDAGVAAGEALAKGLAEGSGRFLGDFQTQVHNWTEYVNSEGGFVGPTEYYDEYVAQKAGQIIRAAEAMQNVQDIQAALQIDTTAAKQQLLDFYAEEAGEDGKSLLEKTLDIDDDQALKDIDGVDVAAKSEMVKPLTLSGVDVAMSQIAGIDDAASQPVTKMIFVQTSYDSSGSGGSGSGRGIWESWGGFPSFATGDVFVRQPTLAVVGDRPGGEWIGGLDQARERFGKGNGGNIVNVTFNNYGTVTGEEIVDSIVSIAKEQIAYEMNRRKY